MRCLICDSKIKNLFYALIYDEYICKNCCEISYDGDILDLPELDLGDVFNDSID